MLKSWADKNGDVKEPFQWFPLAFKNPAEKPGIDETIIFLNS